MRIIAFLGFALLLAALAGACVSIPVVEVGDASLSVDVWALGNATTEQFDSFMASQYADAWTGLNLTYMEKAAIWDFVKNGYSARKMSPAEYSEFLANADAVNNNPLNCGNYPAVAYRSNFAGYVYSDESEKNALCASAPRQACAGGTYHPFMNDLPQPVFGTVGAGITNGTETSDNTGTVGATAVKTPSTTSSIAGGQMDYKYVAGAAVAIILLAGFVAFSITMRRPEEEGIDEALVHRALSSETRIGIMSELQRGERTPTDLSTRLGKSKATVVEHLDRLMDAGFVEKREEEGKKFVFYSLTSRGKAVLRKAG